MRPTFQLSLILTLAGLLAGGCVTIERDATPTDAGGVDSPGVDAGAGDTSVTPDEGATDASTPDPGAADPGLSDPGGAGDAAPADVGSPDPGGAGDAVVGPDACPPTQCDEALPGSCMAWTFDAATCQCVSGPVADGEGCACGGTCQDGVCMLEGGPAGCTDDSGCADTALPGPCYDAVCDPDACTCEAVFNVDCCQSEGLCNDQVCMDGACTPDGCAYEPSGTCVVDEDCDPPSNGCTTVSCNAGCNCQYEVIPGCQACEVNADCGPCGACSLDHACFAAPTEDVVTCLGKDCDDGDPCTADSCNKGDCGGCVHKPLPGCEACQSDADCDDGDPCTDNVCAGAPDKLCYYPLKLTAECHSCVPAGFQTMNAILKLDAGTDIKTGGEAKPLLHADQDCAPCGGDQCCDSCESRPRLVTPLFPDQFVVVDQADEDWRCALSSTCPGEPVTCEPMVAGVDYWAWGTLTAPPPGGPPTPDGSPPPPYLEVEDWCLDMAVDKLPGTYRGQFWAAADHNTRVEVEAVLYQASTSVGGTITSTSIDGNQFLTFDSNELQNVVHDYNAGLITFDVQMTLSVWFIITIDVPITASFVVHGEQNRLVGTWTGTGSFGGTDYLFTGYVDLSRQP